MCMRMSLSWQYLIEADVINLQIQVAENNVTHIRCSQGRNPHGGQLFGGEHAAAGEDAHAHHGRQCVDQCQSISEPATGVPHCYRTGNNRGLQT